MLKWCAYGTCKSNSRGPQSLEGEGVIFFVFLKPKMQEEKQMQNILAQFKKMKKWDNLVLLVDKSYVKSYVKSHIFSYFQHFSCLS